MKVRHFLVVLSSLFCLSSPLSGQSKTLLGGVEHSESLRPIEQTLAPGQIFDLRNLPSQGNGPSRFFKIPGWLAGTWHKESQTDYYRYSYITKQTDITTRTGPARSDGTWGTQRQDDGTVWQYDATPFNSTVDSGSEFVVQLVRVSEPVEESDKIFVRRSIDTQIRVDKMTGRIKAVESGEQLTTYYPEQDGLVKRESSAKVFDANGVAVLLGKSFSYETRVAEFQPQNMYQGKDVRALFVDFIKERKESAASSSSGSSQ
jgi:hypothetical protein